LHQYLQFQVSPMRCDCKRDQIHRFTRLDPRNCTNYGSGHQIITNRTVSTSVDGAGMLLFGVKRAVFVFVRVHLVYFGQDTMPVHNPPELLSTHQRSERPQKRKAPFPIEQSHAQRSTTHSSDFPWRGHGRFGTSPNNHHETCF